MHKRLTQCSGRVKLGPAKGDRCGRHKRLVVDRNDNVRNWFCASHTRKR